MKRTTKWLAAIALALSTLLVGLLVAERFFIKVFLIKWPKETATHDAVIGGTFKNIDLDEEQLAFYVCTEVPKQPGDLSRWIWRCWLDQHPPAIQQDEGLWQSTLRFGNESVEVMVRPNPVFYVVPLAVRRESSRQRLEPVMNCSAPELREKLAEHDAVSCTGSPFRVQRTSAKIPLPTFTSVSDAKTTTTFGPIPDLLQPVCPTSKIEWTAASGNTSALGYEVYFDGLRVVQATGTALSVGDFVGRNGKPAVIDEALWQLGVQLELKISHDPMRQQYRNMYLLRKADKDCP